MTALLPKSRRGKNENIAEEYVQFIAQTATTKAMTTREVEQHSHRNAELSEEGRCIRKGVWNNKECVKDVPVKEELCAIGKVVLCGTHIVISQSLRQQVLAIAHEGHVEIVATEPKYGGMVSTKMLNSMQGRVMDVN